MIFIKRTIFHIDANSAFLSWSAVKLLNEGYEKDIRKIPSVVGGNEQSRKGIVLAASIPAKRLGIKTGEALFSARLKCPSLFVTPAEFSFYEEMSEKFLAICNNYSPVVQKFSIDELFLDYTNMEMHFGPPIEGAKKIKEHIKRELGFTVNIGISENKLLAKMASDFEKPDRVHTLFPDEIEEKMHPLPVGDLFMVGRQTKKKLLSIGIDTIGKLAHTDIELLKRLLNSHGELIYNYANGIDASIVNTQQEPFKSISNGSTLPYDVTSLDEIMIFLLALCEKLGARLRKEGFCGKVVELSIRFNDFSYISHQRKLFYYISSTNDIFKIIKELIGEMWQSRKPIRAVTVGISSLSNDVYTQCSFFDVKNKQKLTKLEQTVDSLRDKFGYHSITRATLIDQKFNQNILKLQNPGMKSYL